MSRLAIESGGRVTRNTNDLTLGAARARRDLACRYELGFYDRSPGEYRERAVGIATTRPGLRVIHGNRYSFRSPAERKQSRLMAAWVAPGMYPGGVVRAHVFPLRPATPRSWETELVVEVPIRLVKNDAPEATYTFGGIVRSGAIEKHRFTRQVRFTSLDKGPLPDRRFSFLQRIDLAPGAYDVTVVLEDADHEEIFTASLRVELPEIPRGESFLVAPILGRRAGADLVVRGGVRQPRRAATIDDPGSDVSGSEASFMPLLVHEVGKDEPVAAWTSACLVTRRDNPAGATIARKLLRADHSPAGTLDPITLNFRGKDDVRCERVLDILPTHALPEGRYSFDVSIDPAPEWAAGAATIPLAVVGTGRREH